MSVGEFAVVEQERELANGVFVWLQHERDELPPALNRTARDRLEEVFEVDPDKLTELRELINQQRSDYHASLRLYVSGFDDEVLIQLGQKKMLRYAAYALAEACREAFPGRQPEAGPTEGSVAVSALKRQSEQVAVKPSVEAEIVQPLVYENMSDEQAKIDDLLKWLRSKAHKAPEDIGAVALERLMVDFGAVPEDLPQLRMLLRNQPVADRQLLRMYVAGFNEDDIRVTDSEQKLNQAVFAFSKVCQGVFGEAPGESDEAPELDGEDDTGTVEQLANVSYTSDIVRQWFNEIGKTPLLNADQEVALAKAVEAGVLASERLDISGATLTEDAKEELETLVAVGENAKEVMIKANLRLAVWIAKRYAGRGMQFLDLVQEGNVGLIRAVEKFDYVKGYKFSTYATWWIRQAMTRGLADQGRAVRLPVHMHDKVNALEKYRTNFLRTNGREATTAEIAEELDISAEQVQKLQIVRQQILSLNTPVGDKGEELGDLAMGTDDTVDVANEALAYRIPEVLGKMLVGLTEREQVVLVMRYGLDGGKERTLAEVGEMIGVTGQRVRQIEAKTMSKLRHPSRSYHLMQLRNGMTG